MKNIQIKRILRRTTILLSILTLSSVPASALIDFETLPGGGTPSDNLALSSGATYSDGGVDVQFGLDLDGFTGGLNPTTDMFFEATGNDTGNGFWYDSSDPTSFDTESTLPGASLGGNGGLKNYFLRTPTPVGGSNSFPTGGLFVISYTGGIPAIAASGEIWDIDTSDEGFTEQWTVTAYNFDGANYNFLAQEVSPGAFFASNEETESLDGQAWTFGFDALANPITHITIAFTGTKTSNIGLAFDNFNAIEVPEPSTYAAIFGALALGLAAYRRRTSK